MKHKLTKPDNDLLRAARNSRSFPRNTCPASRHTHMAAEFLMKDGVYKMFESEPQHVAGSMLATVAALFEARNALNILRPTGIESSDWWWQSKAGKAYLRKITRDSAALPLPTKEEQ